MRRVLPLLLAAAAFGGCKKESEATKPPDGPPAVYAEEKCLDDWLTAHKLDSYGGPEGTMYAGGNPLFNEQTGETKDRLKFVYEKQPDAKAACSPASKKQ